MGEQSERFEIDMVHAGTTLSICKPVVWDATSPEFSTPFWNLTDAFTCNWLSAE